MADLHRSYDAQRDEFNPRSCDWRPDPPAQWTSSSRDRYRRSTSRHPARSQSPRRWSRYRNCRSPSPPPRGDMASRRSRSRSRSPHANYTIETPEQRRHRLLTQKVMAIETYHRLLQDPHSPWSKANKTNSTKMPIPVPLERNENVGDYQQKFEFWLAQRNVTLASLRDDVCLERNYRCGYANWRVQTGFEQTVAEAGAETEANKQRFLRSKSSVRSRYEQESNQFSRSSARSFSRQGSSQRSASTPRPSRFYDVRQARRYDDEKTPTSHDHCKNCGRDWADLNRRVTQLEGIIARLDLPTASIFDGRNSSPYEISTATERSQEESSRTSNFIDLTDDVEDDADGETRLGMGRNPGGRAADVTMADVESRSVEITPTDSDTNQDGPSTVGDLDEPSAEHVQEYELKMPPGLSLLIDAYNQLNDEVLAKQKEEKTAETADKEEETTDTELQSRLCKLRESIMLEKEKRNAAVAAVIVCGCAEKKEKFAREVESTGAPDATNEQDDLHAKCAGIAAQLIDKEKELARLQKQLESVSSLEESYSDLGQREAQDLSSKIRLERASKVALETERQKIFTRLLKASRQIQEFVVKELSSKA